MCATITCCALRVCITCTHTRITSSTCPNRLVVSDETCCVWIHYIKSTHSNETWDDPNNESDEESGVLAYWRFSMILMRRRQGVVVQKWWYVLSPLRVYHKEGRTKANKSTMRTEILPIAWTSGVLRCDDAYSKTWVNVHYLCYQTVWCASTRARWACPLPTTMETARCYCSILTNGRKRHHAGFGQAGEY